MQCNILKLFITMMTLNLSSNTLAATFSCEIKAAGKRQQCNT
jgi:hypothetical protein